MKWSLLVFVISFVYSCNKGPNPSEDDTLILSKSSQVGRGLRLDGFYYFEVGRSLAGIRALFNNGISCNFGSCSCDLKGTVDYVMSQEVRANVRGMKSSWGLFEIDGKIIKINEWEPSGGGPFRAYIREGTILNDTTFHISARYRINDGTKESIQDLDQLYHFQKTVNKLDSVNEFIR